MRRTDLYSKDFASILRLKLNTLWQNYTGSLKNPYKIEKNGIKAAVETDSTHMLILTSFQLFLLLLHFMTVEVISSLRKEEYGRKTAGGKQVPEEILTLNPFPIYKVSG